MGQMPRERPGRQGILTLGQGGVLFSAYDGEGRRAGGWKDNKWKTMERKGKEWKGKEQKDRKKGQGREEEKREFGV